MKVKRGDIVYLKKDFPSEDHIQGGVRPYLVVSNDIGNQHSEICMIVPLTHSEKHLHLPTHTQIFYNHSVVVCEQIFTISQKSIKNREFHLNESEMQKVDRCLKIAIFGRGKR